MNNFEQRCKSINFEISKLQLKQYKQYFNLLVEWNKKMNLTNITEEDEVYEKHFFDSLCIYNNVFGKVADIGSGAGFPGIVLAIAKPEVEFTLIEPLQKRCNFLNYVIEQLNLTNVTVLNERSEDIKLAENFDFVTSRAVAKTNILIELGFKLLKVNGKCLFLKANIDEEEINNAKNALKIINDNDELLVIDAEPIANAKRCIVEITKKISTSEKYPRKFNKIKKQPLGEN